MSFFKITDPNERRRMFEKLSQTRKNVREQFLEDKIGKLESTETLKTFFKPVTESQKESTRDIKEQLTPIREGIANIPALKTLLVPLSISDAGEGEGEERASIGPIAAEYLGKYLNPDEVDATFGIYNDGGTWKMGNKAVKVDGNDFIIGGEKYPGTRGLWELVVKNEPSVLNYDVDDLETYSQILIKTNAIRRDNNPSNPRPKSSRSRKWSNVVKDIWDNRNKYEGQGTETIVIPSDPNALLERLDILMASKEAGNTGTRNELVSICDELLRQKVLNKKQYKNIMSKL